MTGSEKLLRAIGDIDEAMIADAALPYMPIRRFTESASTIAAALIVCIGVVIALARFLPAFAPAGDAGPNMNNGMAGDADNKEESNGAVGSNDVSMGIPILPGTVLENSSGTITYHGIDGNLLSFTVVNEKDITDEIIFWVKLLAPNGELQYATNSNGELGGLKIFVSGVECDRIPTEKGSHEVKIDISGFTKLGFSYSSSVTFKSYSQAISH